MSAAAPATVVSSRSLPGLPALLRHDVQDTPGDWLFDISALSLKMQKLNLKNIFDMLSNIIVTYKNEHSHLRC